MLDLLGGVVLTASLVACLGTLIGAAPARPAARLRAAFLAGAWAAAMIAAALGAFGPGPVPGVGLAALATLGFAAAAWFALPALREALFALPVPLLVSLHVARLFGGLFLLLQAEGRLTAPFAPVAAWGDIAVAVAALPVAVMVHRRAAGWRQVLVAWNGFGAADLVVAVFLGLASTPGTGFRLFPAEPGTLAMGALPWAMIPSLLVPLFLLTHVLIAAQLRRAERVAAPGLGLRA